MPQLEELFEAVVNGDREAASRITQEALAGGIDAMDLLEKAMIPAMDEVGRRFECEDYFVPELLLAARAMKASMEFIRPVLAERGAKPAGRVAIGTIKGDLHDIGKNLVASMLEGGGFEVIDLGADVAPERFVDAVLNRGAQVVCLSALLTVTMNSMRTTIEALERAGVRDRVKVLIGGAPVTAQFAREIRADAYSENANSAVAAARQLVAAQVA